METVTTRIPEDEKEFLERIGEEEGLAQSEVLRKIIRKGTEDWRKQKALEMLEEGSLTVRKAAELADVSYVRMLEMASEKGIETGYTAEELEKDLEWL